MLRHNLCGDTPVDSPLAELEGSTFVDVAKHLDHSGPAFDPSRHHQEPLGFQDPEGFPQGRPRDAVGFDELAFDGEGVIRSQASRDDLRPQHIKSPQVFGNELRGPLRFHPQIVV